MKCRCPACSRNTQVPMDLLGFLARCERCGALLRPKMITEDQESQGVAARGVRLVARAISVGRVHAANSTANGTIAELLCRPILIPALAGVSQSFHRSREEATPLENPMTVSTNSPNPSNPNTLRDPLNDDSNETIQAVSAQRAARRAAIRKAQLRANKLGLGLLGVFGFIMLALLATCLFAVKNTALFGPKAAAATPASAQNPPPK